MQPIDRARFFTSFRMTTLAFSCLRHSPRGEGRVAVKSHRFTSPHDEYRSTTGSPVRTSCVHSSTHSRSLCSTGKTCRPPVQGRANGRRAPEENGRSKKATHRPGSRATGARHDQHARPPGSAIPLQGNRPGTVASPAVPRRSPPCGGPHNRRSSIRANRDQLRLSPGNRPVRKFVQLAATGW
jgi:hypothetical protein